MLKLIWVPKHLKNIKFNSLIKDLKEKRQTLDEQFQELERLLAETKEQSAFNRSFYAGLLLSQNKLANLSEEEAAHNTKIMVEFMEEYLYINKQEETDHGEK